MLLKVLLYVFYSESTIVVLRSYEIRIRSINCLLCEYVSQCANCDNWSPATIFQELCLSNDVVVHNYQFLYPLICFITDINTCVTACVTASKHDVLYKIHIKIKVHQ